MRYRGYDMDAELSREERSGRAESIEAMEEAIAAASAPSADDLAPPPGSWAAVARLMAEGDDSGFDWDAWKDEMKDRDMGL